MTSPQDSIENPPKIITGASGVRVVDIDGHSVVDAVEGFWDGPLHIGKDGMRIAP